MIIPAQD